MFATHLIDKISNQVTKIFNQNLTFESKSAGISIPDLILRLLPFRHYYFSIFYSSNSNQLHAVVILGNKRILASCPKNKLTTHFHSKLITPIR